MASVLPQRKAPNKGYRSSSLNSQETVTQQWRFSGWAAETECRLSRLIRIGWAQTCKFPCLDSQKWATMPTEPLSCFQIAARNARYSNNRCFEWCYSAQSLPCSNLPAPDERKTILCSERSLSLGTAHALSRYPPLGNREEIHSCWKDKPMYLLFNCHKITGWFIVYVINQETISNICHFRFFF